MKLIIITLLINQISATPEDIWDEGYVFHAGELIPRWFPRIPIYPSDHPLIMGPHQTRTEHQTFYSYYWKETRGEGTMDDQLAAATLQMDNGTMLVLIGMIPPISIEPEKLDETFLYNITSENRRNTSLELTDLILCQRYDQETEQLHQEEDNQPRYQREVKETESQVIKTEIQEVHHHHYFRNIGRMVGAASFAHLTFELDLQKMEEELDKICLCTYVKPEDYFVDIKLGIQIPVGMTERLTMGKLKCRDARLKLRRIKESFAPMNLTSSNQETINRQKLLKERFSEEELHFENTLKVVNGTFSIDQELEREKRSVILAGLAISALAGAFSGWHLNNLWNNRNDLNHIIESVNRNDVKIAQLNMNLQSLQVQIEHLKIAHHRLSNYVVFNAMTTLCASEINCFIHHQDDILEGITLLLQRRLHPTLVDPIALEEKFKIIIEKPTERHQYLGLQHINELYQLETSYIVPDENTIVAMVHIPIYQFQTVMSLWEYIPTPLLNFGSKDGYTTYRIKSEKKYLARTIEGYYKELSYPELAQCMKTGDTYTCDHMGVLECFIYW